MTSAHEGFATLRLSTIYSQSFTCIIAHYRINWKVEKSGFLGILENAGSHNQKNKKYHGH